MGWIIALAILVLLAILPLGASVLYDAEGKVVSPEIYKGKTINVKGIVDYFSGDYQIKVFSADDIIVKD